GSGFCSVAQAESSATGTVRARRFIVVALLEAAAAARIRARAVDDVDRPPLGVAELHLQALTLGFGRGGHQLFLGLRDALEVRQRLGRIGTIAASTLKAGEKRALGLLRTDAVVRLGQVPGAEPGVLRAVGLKVGRIRVAERRAARKENEREGPGQFGHDAATKRSVAPTAAGRIRAGAVVDVDRPPLGLAELHL